MLTVSLTLCGYYICLVVLYILFGDCSAIDEFHEDIRLFSSARHKQVDKTVQVGDWLLEWESPSVTIWSRPIKDKDYLEYKSMLIYVYNLNYIKCLLLPNMQYTVTPCTCYQCIFLKKKFLKITSVDRLCTVL